jgi:hypothetical protein
MRQGSSIGAQRCSLTCTVSSMSLVGVEHHLQPRGGGGGLHLPSPCKMDNLFLLSIHMFLNCYLTCDMFFYLKVWM